MEELEKRIASIEQQLETGKEARDYFLRTWKIVLLNFADCYGLEVPALEEIRKEFTQRESHS